MTDEAAATTATGTRALVSDYLHYRLRCKGLDAGGANRPDPDPGRVERTMRALGDEFQERYTQAFAEMCKQLDITQDNARQTFETTASELFRDGVKWGRVVALFAFSGSMAVECVQNGTPFLVDGVEQWTVDYIDAHLQPWIEQNGNWDGLVEFYEGGRPDPADDDSPWPSFSTLCGCAIGVITLGAFFSQKS